MNRRFTPIAVLLILAQSLFAQPSNLELWAPVNESEIRFTGVRQIIPSAYVTVKLNAERLKDILFSAPHEKNTNLRQSPCIITLADPTGTTIKVRVVESPVMDEQLSASFPNMKTFSILGLNDTRISGKVDWNEFGFHGMVFSPRGDFFIDPYCVSNTEDYISYFVTDFQKKAEHRAKEVGLIKDPTLEAERKEKDQTVFNQRPMPAACVGNVLRHYRIAIACTGEYAVAATGMPVPTLVQTLAKVQTSVNRVDGVYENELAVRLLLVASTTLVLYTDPATDSFTGTANTNPGQLINLSQTIITASVGSANFDIGHTFSTGGGGLASFAVVCSASQKASGVTGITNPVGDPYDIDFVAHEVGHQFGADHTFNAVTSSCFGNRNQATSMEPGSGITIMGYAGICGSQDLSNHSIPYFHAASYDQIVNFTNGGGGAGCAVLNPISNTSPIITGAGNYYIPRGTPFYLTGSGSDPDGDTVRYSWEEIDPGASGGNWNSGSKPFFRSYAPDTSSTRFFPNKTVVLAGNYQATKGEYLPNTPQTMNFRITGRDRNGGVCSDVSQVIMDTTGPFKVLYPSVTGITWASGSQQTVTWDLRYTNLPPISCDSVIIFISYDSGKTYQVFVKSAVNFGLFQITVPTVTTVINTCRIKVQGLNNIFYDISDNNFSIVPANTTILEESSENNPFALAVWPNPVQSSLNILAINLDPKVSANVVIKDVLGKEVYNEEFSGRDHLKTQIDLSSFETGLYFVTISNAGHQSVHRIVRQ